MNNYSGVKIKVHAFLKTELDGCNLATFRLRLFYPLPSNKHHMVPLGEEGPRKGLNMMAK
jgi:hypothetical protein